MIAGAIIEDLNVFKYIQSGFISGGVGLVEYQFGFEGTKEAFRQSIVIAIAFAAHTTKHFVFGQQGLIVVAGILTATVGMMEQSWQGLSGGNGHLQGVDDQLAMQALTHRPADDPPCIEIKHHR